MELYFQYPWQIALGAVVPVGLFVMLMYRRESEVSSGVRVTLAAARVCVLMLLVLMLLQPTATVENEREVTGRLPVLVDVSDSMKVRDTRRKTKDLVEAAAALNRIPWPDMEDGETLDLADYTTYLSSEEKREEVSRTARHELVNGVFHHPEINVFERLARNHQLQYYMFADGLRALQPGDGGPSALRDRMPQSSSTTRLGDALQEVVNRAGASPVSGVVLMTDGASNAGRPPERVARRLKEQNIPVYTVGVGLPEPDDLLLRRLVMKDVVFASDLVRARVGLSSRGYENRSVTLRVLLDGAEVARKNIVLKGGAQTESLEFQAGGEPGRSRVRVEVSPLSGEATVANNNRERTIRVVDDRINVLYVEGAPRWEFRYLRAILNRDRRLSVTYMMTRGDRSLAKQSKNHIDHFPSDPASAFSYDLVIIGDVSVSTFSKKQMKRIEELVRDRGGAMLMIAGQQHVPSEYRETPLARMLPVRIEQGETGEVSRHLHPVPTRSGRESMVTTLQSSKRRNHARWSQVKPLGWLPRLAGVKPGTELLVKTSDPVFGVDPYPLVSWQRYGSGKSMFVASDRLWRLRDLVGDEYHTRFWIQAVQFLGLSRLLGENRRLRIETGQTQYDVGDVVHITAHALNEAYKASSAPFVTVQVQHVDREKTVPLKLKRVPDVPGLYHGTHVPDTPGRYVVKAGEEREAEANRAEFDLREKHPERRETAMKEDRLRKIARMTGGRYSRILNLPGLDKTIQPKREKVTIEKHVELWDTWPALVFFLLMVGLEWTARRLNGLA